VKWCTLHQQKKWCQTQNQSKLCVTECTPKLLIIEWPICSRLCSTYKTVQIKNCLNRTFATKVATMKIMDDFCCKWKPSHTYYTLTLFAVNKDEWDTKEGTGKSMKNALYAQRYGKRHPLGWSNVGQWKKNQFCSLSHCRVTRHQLVSTEFH